MSFLENKEILICKVKLYLGFKLTRKLGRSVKDDFVDLIYGFTMSVPKIIVSLFLLQV